MLKWGGMALAAGVLLGLASDAHAQKTITFVPVDTTKNQAAPVPLYGRAQPTGSYFDRFYNTLASIVPFMTPRTPQMPIPRPARYAGQPLQQPLKPTLTPQTPPTLPSVPTTGATVR